MKRPPSSPASTKARNIISVPRAVRKSSIRILKSTREKTEFHPFFKKPLIFSLLKFEFSVKLLFFAKDRKVPLSLQEGEAVCGEHPRDPLFFRGFPMKIGLFKYYQKMVFA
jgi:hypothetical protein